MQNIYIFQINMSSVAGLLVPNNFRIYGDNIISPFQNYTPTFTNLTLGSGVVNEAKYNVVGNICNVYLKVTLAADSAVTGVIVASLPVASAGSTGRILGSSVMFSAGGGIYVPGVAEQFAANGSTFDIRVHNSSGTYVLLQNTSNLIPFTWATGDIIEVTMSYEVA